jgi:hypothetical protein
MQVESQITSITNRHVARIMTALDDAGIASVCTDAVKREMWYLHDDIQQVVSSSKEHVNGTPPATRPR